MNCLSKSAGSFSAPESTAVLLCRAWMLILLVGLVSNIIAAQEPPADMSLIPAGEFWMGRVHFFLTDAIGWFERDRQDDVPAHRVSVSAFFMDRYEVTNEGFARFLEATKRKAPWHWKGGSIPKGEEKHPIYNVTWEEADSYCRWAGKRLPSEAEWEKAARGGLDRQKYPWGDTELGMAGYQAAESGLASKTGNQAHTDYPFGPAPVGSYPANGYGLYDMAGNVWEWVNDWHARHYYSISPIENPPGPETGKYKIIRGGGWSDDDERNLMNSFRSYTDPAVRSTSVGFRCAMSPKSGSDY
jgi:formylglycine-generating enzyme required for sulfatase activity